MSNKQHTRIRYKDTFNDSGHCLVSKEKYRVRNAFYTLQINLYSLAYYLLRDDNRIVNTGQASTLNQVKAIAKKSLEDIGVEFKRETRRKRVIGGSASEG